MANRAYYFCGFNSGSYILYQLKGGEMKKETLKLKVDIQHLMLQAAQEMKTPGISIGFHLAANTLQAIVRRAIELDDEQLLSHLETLCLISKKE